MDTEIDSTEFTAIVTDACGNSSEKKFTISKIDAMPPISISSSNIGVNWAKSKVFSFIANDSGIGNVSIAFNDVADYKLANKNDIEYSRDYKFIGDIYTETEARVFYKDELGNVSFQTVTIDKIDNTSPTIVNIDIHNNKLLVNSNDVKKDLGEGSGVAKYRYIVSRNKLDNPDVSSGIEVGISDNFVIDDICNVKYIYVVAEDLVR